jgi:hypothetical protein
MTNNRRNMTLAAGIGGLILLLGLAIGSSSAGYSITRLVDSTSGVVTGQPATATPDQTAQPATGSQPGQTCASTEPADTSEANEPPEANEPAEASEPADQGCDTESDND